MFQGGKLLATRHERLACEAIRMTPEILSSLKWTLLELVPAGGEPIGNITLKPKLLELATARYNTALLDEDYERIKDALVAEGILVKGQGRGGSMRRTLAGPLQGTGLAPVEIAASVILEILPSDGSSKSNQFMATEVDRLAQERYGIAVSKDQYQEAREILTKAMLLEKGSGYTGTVRRFSQRSVPQEAPPTPESQSSAVLQLAPKADDMRAVLNGSATKLERELYAPLKETLVKHWIKRHGIDDHVCEITASQGSRDTGGKWTRPDLTLVAVRTFEFVYGKSVEVITFEVKPLDAYGVEGVFETASHTVAANLSYLLLHVRGELESAIKARLEKLAVKFGVGLVTFREPSDWESFTFIVEAVHNVPEPSEISGFISSQLSAENKSRITRLLK